MLEWEAILFGIEPIVAIGVGLAALVLAPVVGSLTKPELGQSITDTGRDVVKNGLKFSLQAFESVQSTVAEAGESWNDLVAEAKAETVSSQNTAQPPEQV